MSASFAFKKAYNGDTRKLNKPKVILLSRLQLHGEVLYKKLRKICDAVWIGWKFPYPVNFLNALFLLFYEFLCLIQYHNQNIKSEHEAPIILVHFISLDSLIALFFKELFNYRVILYAIGSDILGIHNAIHRIILRLVIPKADIIFCVNRVIRNYVNKIGNENTIIIPTPFVEPDIEDCFSLKGKPYDVITVGVLEPVKAHDLLIQACKYLDSGSTIAIVGEGSLRSYLVDLARQYKNQKILFLGKLPQRNVWVELQKAKVYVHTSTREGIPASILEAIWFGLPIICIKASYTRDLTEIYGFKIFEVEERTPYALASTIKRVLNNYESYKEITNLNKELLKNYIKHWNCKLRSIISHKLSKNNF